MFIRWRSSNTRKKSDETSDKRSINFQVCEKYIAISGKLWYVVSLKGDGLFEKANNRRNNRYRLCRAVCPRSAEVKELPTESVKAAVIAAIRARPEETPGIFISAENPAPKPYAVAESEPEETEITAEKETGTVPASEIASTPPATPKPAATSVQPRMGDVRVINGEKQIYIDGFGWIKDEGDGSHETMVGNLGDELKGNKVGNANRGIAGFFA